MFVIQIKKFNLSLHSDLIKTLPEQIIFPLLKHTGFNTFDITEDHLNNIIIHRGKSYGIVNFTNISSYHNEQYDLSLIIKLIDDLFILKKRLDNSQQYGTNIDSLFCSPKYNLTNEFAFDKYVDQHWSTLLSLLFKLDCPYIIINIPPLEIPTKQIEANLTYYHKFLSKLKTRIIKLSKEASRNEVKMLLKMDKQHYISQDSLDHSVFRDFKEFRAFYEVITEDQDNIGLHIDIPSFFLFESNKICAKLIANQEPDIPLDDLKRFENYLLRNPRLSENIFESICKIDGLYKIGLSDVQWLEAFNSFYKKKHNLLQVDERELQNSYQNLVNSFNVKTLPGYGTLPIKSFLLFGRQLNPSGNFPHNYSYDIPLNIEKPDLHAIDWRNIDLTTIDFDSQTKESIFNYLKQSKNLETIDINLIKNMDIFSPVEIFKSLKDIYLYL